MKTSNETRDATRRLASAASAHLTRLKDEVNEAKRVAAAWERLDDYVARDWPIHLSNLLRVEREAILGHPQLSDTVRATLNELADRATSDATHVLRRYPALLETACKERNLPLDHDSRDPRYCFRDKLITVAIDNKKRTAKLSTNEGVLDRMPADVEPVLNAVARELSRLFNRSFDASRFTKLLRKHYLAECKKEKAVDGDAIPIRSITRRMSKSNKAFRIDEFITDLSRLLDADVPMIDDRRLDLQQTKDTKQGVLLHGTAARGYVGFLLFRKALSP